MAARLYRMILLAALLAAGLLATGFHLLGAVSGPAAVILGLVTVFGGHALVLGVEFALVSRLNAARPVLAAYPVLGTALPLLVTWLVEVPSAWRTFFFAIPFFGHRPLASGRDFSKTPVVLLHGYTCNRAVWRPFASWLAGQGYAITAPNLEPLTESIDLLTGQIDAAVNDLKNQTGASQVALIGHSMGGVAIRAYLRDYGSASISRVITVGSPHQGTWLARIAFTPLARELNLNSEWLRKLAATESDQTGQLFSTIVSTDDNIIAPASIQTLPGSKVVFFRGLGHVDLIYRLSVWVAIRSALTAKNQLENESPKK
ncbi:MAG: alpha/beta fold hydrolase [Burkholderiaceae bacterium]